MGSQKCSPFALSAGVACLCQFSRLSSELYQPKGTQDNGERDRGRDREREKEGEREVCLAWHFPVKAGKSSHTWQANRLCSGEREFEHIQLVIRALLVGINCHLKSERGLLLLFLCCWPLLQLKLRLCKLCVRLWRLQHGLLALSCCPLVKHLASINPENSVHGRRVGESHLDEGHSWWLGMPCWVWLGKVVNLNKVGPRISVCLSLRVSLRFRCGDCFDLCAVFRLTAHDLAWPAFPSIFTLFCQWIKTYGVYLSLVLYRLEFHLFSTPPRPQCTSM